jgi:hypothetical protein
MLFKDNTKPITNHNELKRFPSSYCKYEYIAVWNMYTVLATASTSHAPRRVEVKMRSAFSDTDMFLIVWGNSEYRVSHCGFFLVICGHFNRILKRSFHISSVYCIDAIGSLYL